MKRISTQLVISFLIVALLPTLPLSLVVQNLLERRFGPSITGPMEQALESGLAESRAHLNELRLGLGNRAKELSAEVWVDAGLLLNLDGGVQPADSLEVFLAERPGIWDKISMLEIFEFSSEVQAERFGDVLAVRVKGAGGAPLAVLQPLPPGMVERAGNMTGGISLLRVIRGEDKRVVLSYVGPFVLVYGVLILLALAVGIVWSRKMVKPLEALVGATARVAEGDLEFKIKQQGPGEVGELVRSFDQMVNNLAEQRRDLARLERATAWRGMSRTLAHEVKNPLTPILLAVNQARDCYHGDDEEYQALLTEVSEIVSEEVESLRRLVRTFGDFARLPKPELQQGDLKKILGKLSVLYGQNRLQIEAAPTPAVGWFDHDAIRRALVNLIDNGLTACAEAGKTEIVMLKLTHNESGAEIVVTDNGAGITRDNLSKIFEPDFTTKGSGMGLGLAIVENIIIGHGGRIEAESEIGNGAQFIITLPLTPVGTGQQFSRDGEQ